MLGLQAIAAQFAQDCHGDIPDLDFAGAAFDSRTVKPGQMYFAFVGQRADGHDFLAQAQSQGAVCAVVSRPCAVDLPQIIVQDPQAMFIALAAIARAAWQNKTVVAITGSMGKTSCKSLLAGLCAAYAPTFATPGNYNNLLGLSWTVLNTPETARYVVLELGISEVGEMAELVALAKPDVAWVTNVAPCHLTGLTSEAVIAHEKSYIYRGLSAKGIAIIHNRDAQAHVFLEASQHCQRVMLYDSGDVCLHEASIVLDAAARPYFEASIHGICLSSRLAVMGKHQVYNAYAAAVTAHAMAVPLPVIAEALPTITGASSRAQSYALLGGKALLIDDSYNANPFAMRAAIATLAAVDKPYRCLVMGDMYELGDASVFWHCEVGRWAQAAGIDMLITFGHDARAAMAFFAGSVVSFTDHHDLIAYLGDLVRQEMVVLIKGSRGCALDICVTALRQAGDAEEVV